MCDHTVRPWIRRKHSYSCSPIMRWDNLKTWEIFKLPAWTYVFDLFLRLPTADLWGYLIILKGTKWKLVISYWMETTSLGESDWNRLNIGTWSFLWATNSNPWSFTWIPCVFSRDLLSRGDIGRNNGNLVASKKTEQAHSIPNSMI